MKKRITGLLLALCLCLTLLPGTAFAATPATETADFTVGQGREAITLLNQYKTGTAESLWDNTTKTLTLWGIDFTTTAQTAVKLPAGSTIVLKDGTSNTIQSGDVTMEISGDYKNQAYVNALDVAGSLTIQGGTAGSGTLSVCAGKLKNSGDGWVYSTGISVDGDFTVEGGQVTARGGCAESDGSCFSYGVKMDSDTQNKELKVTGGTLTAIADKAYILEEDGTKRESFSRGVEMFRGNVSVSGNGKLHAESVKEMADATVMSNGLYISAGNLTVANSAEVAVAGADAAYISGGSLRLEGGSLTAVSTQTADDNGNLGCAIYMDLNKQVADSGSITVSGGTLETVNGYISMPTIGATGNQSLFTVTGGTIENSGQISGAKKLDISGGTVQSQGVVVGALTLSGGTLTIREAVRKNPYHKKLLVRPAVDASTLTVSGGTLDAAWYWGQFTPPIVFPVDDYYGYADPLVKITGYNSSATFNGGTTILDTGCAGNTALKVETLNLGSGIYGSGYTHENSSDTYLQENNRIPVRFGPFQPKEITVSGIAAENKTYDGTVAAILTGGTLNDIGNDDVQLDFSEAKAEFDNKNVGKDKEVTIKGTLKLKGTDAGKYTLTQPTGLNITASITAASFTGPTNKSQTIYVGESSFEAPKFTGVTVGGLTETVTGNVTYKVGNDTKTMEQIGTDLKALKTGEKLEISYTFTPAKDGNYSGEKSGTITVTAKERPSSGGSGSPSYAITLPDKTEHGTVTANRRYAERGDSVTITVKPDSGYVLETLTATDRNGKELKLTDKGDGKYTFTMPSGKVEVKATFMEDNSVLNFFYDVPNDAYYYETVKWAVEKGITTGIGDNLFAPGGTCTRAQAVTFLWRAAGSPEPKSSSSFSDVAAGSYYAKAVAWAIENGITNGTGGDRFSPDADCTRAQIVTFLYRYMQSQGKGFTGEWMFQLPFTDVPEWCYEAVAWCYMEKVTDGTTTTTFSPDDDCTRAQIVTFLYRCMK